MLLSDDTILLGLRSGQRGLGLNEELGWKKGISPMLCAICSVFAGTVSSSEALLGDDLEVFAFVYSLYHSSPRGRLTNNFFIFVCSLFVFATCRETQLAIRVKRAP